MVEVEKRHLVRHDAAAHAEVEAAAREVVEHAHLLDEPQRIVQRQAVDAGAQTDAPRALGGGGEEESGHRGEAQRGGVMLGEVIGVEARRVVLLQQPQPALVVLVQRHVPIVQMIEDPELHGARQRIPRPRGRKASKKSSLEKEPPGGVPWAHDRAVHPGRIEEERSMAYDLLIKNGWVVDGSGRPRYRADVGVSGGRIAAIGRIRESAREVLDAEGQVVSPGFVDGHTHMDAQVFWDPLGTCSCWHGITTVVMGNCGFTLAPCAKEDRHLVIRNLQRAEDISAGGDGSGHRVEVEDLRRVPRYRRRAPQGHQLLGLHGPLRAAHLCHGRARLRAGGVRGRSPCHGSRAAQRAARRRHRVHDLPVAEPRDPGPPAGGEPARQLGRGPAAGRRDGRHERRHLRARR